MKAYTGEMQRKGWYDTNSRFYSDNSLILTYHSYDIILLVVVVVSLLFNLFLFFDRGEILSLIRSECIYC